jgi:hypothetical protein
MTSDQFTLVAIDPGVNGGIAWTLPNGAITTAKMPDTEYGVVMLLVEISKAANGRCKLYLEEPPLFAGQNIPGSAIGKLMWNAGICYGAAVALGWTIHRIRPAIWMKAHAVGTKKSTGLSGSAWKNRLKAKAAELHADLKITLWNADAVLILDAARRGAIN